uniref:Uncharacterized protein n=1 Tax=viral metagenome TaxID=1070528 RepID=A0A6C0K0Y7_9ZZZZ
MHATKPREDRDSAANATHSQRNRDHAVHHDREGNKRIPRFARLETSHVEAIETCVRRFPVLGNRLEVHLPGHRARQIFEREKLVVWPKFDRRPACFLFFLEGFAPCLWDPSRQEGLTFRWILPPGFGCGATVCLANLLKGESVLQIEDLLVYEGKDLWTTNPFSERWNQLKHFWNRLPAEQPLLAITPRIVSPVSLADWDQTYDASLSWIIQPDSARSQRFYWWDSVTPKKENTYRPPTLVRAPEIQVQICALAKPYTKIGLPDAYQLEAGDNSFIGIASIATMALSQQLRSLKEAHVEVIWNEEFRKYQITKVLPEETPVSAASFFRKA